MEKSGQTENSTPEGGRITPAVGLNEVCKLLLSDLAVVWQISDPSCRAPGGLVSAGDHYEWCVRGDGIEPEGGFLLS